MRISRLGCFVVVLAVITGSASASTIRMVGGGGSEPFTGTLNITLNDTGTGCETGDCFFENATGATITQVDFLFTIPQQPDNSYGCEVQAFPAQSRSPFADCSVVFNPDFTQVTFEFFGGSLPVGSEFGLQFPVAFPGDTSLTLTVPGQSDPNATPEPGSGALLLTCLGGILIVWRGRRGGARSRA